MSVDIDQTIRALYDSMCFDEGGAPDWELFTSILAPNARLVRVNDDGVFEFTVDTFRQDIDEKMRSGSLPSFSERELSRSVQRFDDIAHVLSIYEARSSSHGEILFRAAKSMQLFRRNDRWIISALLWRRGLRDTLSIGGDDVTNEW